jgi:rhodanese-related sulfurtransferase
VTTNTVSAVELRRRLADGEDVRLVDVRTAAEFETGHIPASYHVPLDALNEHREEFRGINVPVVLVCQSGNRAAQAADSLGQAGMANVGILDGGIARWIANGGDVNRGHARWSLERQVRLVAGAIVLVAVLVSLALPEARLVAGLVGAGLVLAAVTDTCAMGLLLARLPYNRGAACDMRAVVRQLTDGRPAPLATNEGAR